MNNCLAYLLLVDIDKFLLPLLLMQKKLSFSETVLNGDPRFGAFSASFAPFVILSV